MRVRFVGGPLSVLFIICLVSSNSVARIQGFNSESDEGEYEKTSSVIDANTRVSDNNNNQQQQDKNAKIQLPTSDAEAKAAIAKEISSHLERIKLDEANLAAASSVHKRDQVFGAPKTYETSYPKDNISPPINPAMKYEPPNPNGDETSDLSLGSEEKPNKPAESTARGFSNPFNGPNAQPGPPQMAQQPQMQAQPAMAPQTSMVAQDDLPTIIENNQQVDPNKPPQPVDKMQQPQVAFSNSSLAQSSARTFDSWTNCIGSQSNKYGTCKNDVECEKHKGRADGSCMGGLGVCCVMALTCNDKSIENNTFFANPDFPEPSWEARQCQVEVNKKASHVVQIMIEFDEFELAPPNNEGECITDVFQIRLASNKPSPYSNLRICGHNTGQHLYLDVSQVDEPLVLSVATSGGGFPRRWSIRIVQLDHKNALLAPPGCLQYYTDTVGHFRSFNLGKNLKNLYYAICFRIDNGYSGIRFTSNFFGMNGPFCRKRIGKQYGQGTLSAHPHHLVIPPPGSAIPLPRPYANQQPLQIGGYSQQPQQYQQQPYVQQGASGGQKFKRQAPPTGLVQGQALPNQGAQAAGRTLSHIPSFGLFGGSDKEAKLEGKEFEKGEHHKQQQPYPQYPPQGQYNSGYSPSPNPYYPPQQPSGYGQPPQIIYGNEPGKGGLGGDKELKPEHFGWKGGDEGKYSEGGYSQPPPSGYGPPPPPGYGPPPPPGYGPPSYGPPGSYGPPAGYHHKEIGKFGEKYEHLHEKQEKNHHHGKDEKSGSSWWPNFGFMHGKDKDGKKDKDKFFMHHEALFPLVRMPEMPHCDPRYCGANDVITFPPSGDSIAEMCGNSFNRGRGPKIISGSPLVVYVSNRGMQRGSGFDMNYEQVFYIPKPY